MHNFGIYFANNSSVLAAYFFCFIIISAFVKLLAIGDNIERTLQKVIGGLTVFIVAIIANRPYIYIVSLFIGGLIIASEDFMKFLAAILKSRNDKVAETVSAFKVSHASLQEIEAKVQEETIETEPVTAQEKIEIKPTIAQRAERLKLVETLVNSYFKNIYGSSYTTQIKVTNKYGGSMIIDAMIGKIGGIKKIIEIRYISSKSFSSLIYQVGRFIEKIKDFNVNKPILFVFVSDDMTVQASTDINQEIRNKYDIRLAFFKFTTDKIEPVMPTNSGTTVFEYDAM